MKNLTQNLIEVDPMTFTTLKKELKGRVCNGK